MSQCRHCIAMPLAFVVLTAIFFASSSNRSAGQTITDDSQWTQLRGKQGRGVADETAKPAVKIDLKKQQVWSSSIPGTGWSSPVYDNGDLIWLTSAVPVAASEEEIKKKLAGDPLAQIKTLAKTVELRAIAIDKVSGQIKVNQLLTKVDSPEPINPMNSYASPTPAISDGKVVCHFGNYGTWCLDAKTGKEVWDAQYVVKHSVGPGSSPVIFEDRVILVCDGTDKQFIVGLDLASGKQIFKTNRPPIKAPNGEHRKAYSTPILIEANGKKQFVVPGAEWVAGYDLVSGNEIWRFNHGRGFSVTPMPVFDSGVVVFSTGYMRPEFVAVDPTGTGDVTSSHLKWRATGSSTMPSFVVNAGRLYSISDKGIMTCLDMKTGEQLNRKRIGGNYSSSPMLAGGNLYMGTRDGELKVVKCSSDLELVTTNRFEGSIMACPILIGNDLLVRTEKALLRIKP